MDNRTPGGRQDGAQLRRAAEMDRRRLVKEVWPILAAFFAPNRAGATWLPQLILGVWPICTIQALKDFRGYPMAG